MKTLRLAVSNTLFVFAVCVVIFHLSASTSVAARNDKQLDLAVKVGAVSANATSCKVEVASVLIHVLNYVPKLKDLSQSPGDYERSMNLIEEGIAGASLFSSMGTQKPEYAFGESCKSVKKRMMKGISEFVPVKHLNATSDIRNAEVSNKQSKWQDAVNYYTRAIISETLNDQQLEEALIERGGSLVKMSLSVPLSPDILVQNYTSALKVNPQNVEALYWRCRGYDSMKKYDEALDDINEAIRLVPDVALFYYERGSLYETAGQQSKAMIDFIKAHELKPSDAEYEAKVKEYDLLKQ